MTHAPVGSRTSSYSRSYSSGYSTGYRGSPISGEHAPVGTGQCSMLNGHTYTRSQGNTTCAYWTVPASFEHAEQTREEGSAQKFEGAKQIYESVVDAVTNPEPAGAGGIFAGLASYFSGSQKQYDANAEMMQAARDQVSANRGGSPDAMNMESHGGGCVIA
jgi:hypothetical protein